jgi:hypothetical protein
MEGGRSQLIWEKSANLALLSSLKALNNEARQQNKGAHGDGKSLLLERAQNKQNQSNGKMRRGVEFFKVCLSLWYIPVYTYSGGPLS